MSKLDVDAILATVPRCAGVTEGEWMWGKQRREEPMGTLFGGSSFIMDFGDATQFYPSEGTPPEGSDKQLIADAKTNAALVEALTKALEQVQGWRSKVANQDYQVPPGPVTAVDAGIAAYKASRTRTI